MSVRSWRFLDTGYGTGPWNMALDEAIVGLHSQGKSPPTLRLYTWSQPCLSIGYFQSAEKDINLQHCQELGVSLVRRPTGGRAVLHDSELTYSVITSEKDPLVLGGILEAYHKISLAIALGLGSLGMKVEMVKPRRGIRSRSGACFDIISAYELTVDGRKIVGSAQVRRDGALLQHGSILLGLNGIRLSTLLQGAKMGRDGGFGQRAISLEEVLGHPISPEEVMQTVRQGFEKAWDLTFEEGEILPEERALADRLATEKYDTKEWNLRR